MSHEKSSTPIDPNDTEAVMHAFNTGFQKMDIPMSGALAVARAVCPDGYMVVPVELLSYLLECLPIGYADEAALERIYSMFPEEAER